jgi:hypothetical protein
MLSVVGTGDTLAGGSVLIAGKADHNPNDQRLVKLLEADHPAVVSSSLVK